MTRDRDTWLPFSRDEVREIRAALGRADAEPVCPVCGKPLIVSGPRRNAFDVRCKPCQRHTIVPQEVLDTPI